MFRSPSRPLTETSDQSVFRTLRPGLLSFRTAQALQERLVEQCAAGGGDVLILLRHQPVITLGRRSRIEHLLRPEAELRNRGIDVVEAGRGGDVTFHGPGQLIGYPIIDLTPRGRDLHRFLRQLEEVLIETLTDFGIEGARRTGRTGVWVGEEKIASIGIGVRRWISWHGFALNIGADLAGFSAIVPCGLTGVKMTSMEDLLGRTINHSKVETSIIDAFSRIFRCHYAGEVASS